MSSDLTQIAAGGIFALMVLDKVFSFLKGKNGTSEVDHVMKKLGAVLQESAHRNAEMSRKVDDIHVRTERWDKSFLNGDVRCKFTEREATRIVDALHDNT